MERYQDRTYGGPDRHLLGHLMRSRDIVRHACRFPDWFTHKQLADLVYAERGEVAEGPEIRAFGGVCGQLRAAGFLEREQRRSGRYRVTPSGRTFAADDDEVAAPAASGIFSVDAGSTQPGPAPGPCWTFAPNAPGGSILFDGVGNHWGWDAANAIFFFWSRASATSLPPVPPLWVHMPHAPEHALLLCAGNYWWVDRSGGYNFRWWSRAS